MLAACAKVPLHAEKAPQLAGEWVDGGGMVVTLVEDKGVVTVASIIDSDKEVFELQRSEWTESGHFEFEYLVPSTEYQVTIHIDEIKPDSLPHGWNNIAPDGTTAEGTDVFTRRR